MKRHRYERSRWKRLAQRRRKQLESLRQSGKRIADFDEQVNVTKEGDIVAAGKDGREFHRKNHDGTNSVSNDDQSISTKDDKGRVVEVTYPDAKQNGFGYDEKGQLSQIDANDGSHWNKENGKWVHYDRNDRGEAVPRPLSNLELSYVHLIQQNR